MGRQPPGEVVFIDATSRTGGSGSVRSELGPRRVLCESVRRHNREGPVGRAIGHRRARARNAPNPAGQAILNKHFKGGIAPTGLLKAALAPTVIMFLAYAVFP